MVKKYINGHKQGSTTTDTDVKYKNRICMQLQQITANIKICKNTPHAIKIINATQIKSSNHN